MRAAVVAPGFIDTHTHTDPQVFWDPTLDPEPLHGVTTVVMGNCSLSLYPVSNSTRAEIADLFSYIEDVPRHLFDDEVPWTWTDFAGYRDTVNATGAGVNLAGLVGHSPLRLAVMGADAWTRPARVDELAAMAALLRASLAAGAFGLSTSFLDIDAHGRPVPSRIGDGAELDALLDVVAAHGRGFVEFVPGFLEPGPEIAAEDLAQRCGARGLTVTWTGFAVSQVNPHGAQCGSRSPSDSRSRESTSIPSCRRAGRAHARALGRPSVARRGAPRVGSHGTCDLPPPQARDVAVT